jgi:hypothetical protein
LSEKFTHQTDEEADTKHFDDGLICFGHVGSPIRGICERDSISDSMSPLTENNHLRTGNYLSAFRFRSEVDRNRSFLGK